MPVKRMFRPGAIGSATIRNRIVMPAMATNFASACGEPTARMMSYYAARARGGAGLIVVENASIDEPAGGNGAVQLRIDHDRYVPALSALTAAIQENGAASALQINHAGSVAKPQRTGVPAVAPSPVGWTEASPSPVALEAGEIERLIERYAQAALRAKRSRFDAVEIHGAHGYLIAQFLSPITNRRTDAYGGSTERRWRFALDVVRAVRQAVGPDFPILFRLSGDEFMPGGRSLEESVDLSCSLVESGIDALHVSAGTAANPEKQLEPMSYPEGWRAYLAAAIRPRLAVPVITVGVFRQPGAVERALEQEQADFVAIGRGLIADPEWPNKVRTGREASIRRCISCNRCVRHRVTDDLPIRCSVNPCVGFENEIYAPVPRARCVAVIGSGPAGLQAAATAAGLGSHVTLFEQQEMPGGQLQAAALPPHKDKIRWLIEDLVHALPACVETRLGTEADPDAVCVLGPDAVILATGGRPAHLDVPTDPQAFPQTAESLLRSVDDLTGVPVAVIGAGMVGCETALACAARGADVLLIEVTAHIGQDCEPISRSVLLRHLEQEGVRILTEARVLEIRRDSVVVDEGGVTSCVPAARVVSAVGVRPNDELAGALRKRGLSVEVIGDALRPRGVAEAVYEGWRAGQRAAIGSLDKQTSEETSCNESYE
jgi:2,4-dienoyl-CoA reductase-like NADH-dependent reductase (Old Yellow Enzyme family)